MSVKDNCIHQQPYEICHICNQNKAPQEMWDRMDEEIGKAKQTKDLLAEIADLKTKEELYKAENIRYKEEIAALKKENEEFKEENQKLIEVSEWISVTDKLPENEREPTGYYWGYFKNKKDKNMNFQAEVFWDSDYDGGEFLNSDTAEFELTHYRKAAQPPLNDK